MSSGSVVKPKYSSGSFLGLALLDEWKGGSYGRSVRLGSDVGWREV